MFEPKPHPKPWELLFAIACRGLEQNYPYGELREDLKIAAAKCRVPLDIDAVLRSAEGYLHTAYAGRRPRRNVAASPEVSMRRADTMTALLDFDREPDPAPARSPDVDDARVHALMADLQRRAKLAPSPPLPADIPVPPARPVHDEPVRPPMPTWTKNMRGVVLQRLREFRAVGGQGSASCHDAPAPLDDPA